MNTHKSITNAADSHELLSCSFNQDQGCFAISHDHGFRVYSTDPLEQRVDHKFDDGGVGVVQMLHRTNYLAIVGGGRNPKFSQNKVVIWDDLKKRPALSLEFLSAILNVRLSRTKIVIVLANKVHIYAFSSPPTRIAYYDTVDNPHGIVAMSDSCVAFPSRTEGQIQIVNFQQNEDGLVSIVRAHQSRIRCLALNSQGTVLASASENGTIVRMHSTQNTGLLHEFRRGLDRAVIYSMQFSESSSRLALLSDKNTLHVFDTSQLTSSNNRRHLLSKVPLLPAYFSSQWSFVSTRVDGSRGVVGWSGENSVIVVWTSPVCKWEKYSIVERELTASTHALKDDESKYELVREAWRGFEGLSHD